MRLSIKMYLGERIAGALEMYIFKLFYDFLLKARYL